MKLYNKKYILPALVIAFSAMTATAQSLRSSYFLEGATFRHQMNPAFIGERGYFSLPVLGNTNVSAQGNIGVNNFVYKNPNVNSQYDMTTFLDGNISRAEFLDKLNTNNNLGMNVNMNLLSFGFHAWGGFNTFEIAAHSNTDINLPYDLFDFMKSGLSGNNTYHINDLRVRTNNYVDLSLGHARKINEKLTVGAKMKLLFGLANFDMNYDALDVALEDDHWQITSAGELNAAMKGVEFEYKDSNLGDGRRQLDGLDVDGFGIGGMGFAVDLGATYKLDDYVDGLTVSAALIDLGFISWKDNYVSKISGTKKFEGFTDFAFDDESKQGNISLEDQLDDLMDDFESVLMPYEPKEGNVAKKRNTGLATTLNVGVEYALPYYKKLTFGLLSSTRFNKPNTWTEARFSANVSPVNWFNASVNYAASTYGHSFGWVLNFHPKGINFFVGSDHMIFDVTPQFIPVGRANANVNFGLNFTFGGPKKSVLAAN